jgi:photosystem II stability/assembly factor-like uncharacterized protein
MASTFALIAILGFSWVLPETASVETGIWRNVGPEGGSVDVLRVDPQNPSTIYAVTRPGAVYKSTNGGTTWARSEPPYNVSLLVVDPLTPTTLYAAGRGILKSTDGGASWNEVYSGWVGSLSIDPQNPRIVYAGNNTHLLKTDNAGGSWTVLTAVPTLSAILAIEPQTPGTIYVRTSEGPFKSMDGGNSWRAANSGLAETMDSFARHRSI